MSGSKPAVFLQQSLEESNSSTVKPLLIRPFLMRSAVMLFPRFKGRV